MSKDTIWQKIPLHDLENFYDFNSEYFTDLILVKWKSEVDRFL